MAELISGPVMSVALIILAGIALRYALRTGKDRESSQVRSHDERSERIAALSIALECAQRDQVTAQENFERVTQDYETLKRSVDARDVQWNQQRSETGHKLAMLEELSQSKQASDRALRELTSELHGAQTREVQLRNELSELQHQLAQLQEDNQQLQVELDQVRQLQFAAHQAELSPQPDSRYAEHEELARQLREANVLNDELDQQHSHLKRENDRLQQQLREEQSRIGELMRAAAAMNEAHEQSERTCAALQTELCEAELEVSRLRRHTEELPGLQDEVTSLRHELGFQIQEDVRLRAENRELRAALATITEQGQQLSTQIAELRESLETSNHQVTLLKAENRFNGQLRQENGTLHGTLIKQDKLIAELQINERSLRDQVKGLQAELTQQTSRQRQMELHLQNALAQAATQAAELDQQKSRAQETAARLAQQQAAYDDQLRIMRTEKDELARGLQREQQTAAQLKEVLQAESDRLRKLQFELSHLELLRRDHQAVVAELGELKQEHAAASQKLGQSEAQLRGIQDKVLAIGSRAKHHEQELLQERGTAQTLREENARLKVQFGQLQAEKAAIEQLLQVHADTLQKLRADSLSIETLLERQAAVQSSLREHADRLRAVAADLRAGHDQAGLAQTAESMATVLSFTRPRATERQPSTTRPNSRVA